MLNRVPPALQEAFEVMLSTPAGKELGEAMRRRHSRFIVDPTPLLGRAYITLNILRLAVIGAEVARGEQFIRLVESVAMRLPTWPRGTGPIPSSRSTEPL